MSLAHFIITRFNLRRDPADTRAIDPDWLRGRFDLFDRFCYPSVRAQSVQDFKWLVLFDQRTPRPAVERIRQYQRWENFVPVFFAPGSTEQARDAVLEELGPDRPAVILTTRLDNDDGVSRTFIEDIRRHAGVPDATTSTLIEFPIGYVWHRGRIYVDRQERNPFTTLVEPIIEGKPFRTIFGTSHHDIGRGCRVIQAGSTPAWVQVIHGGNVANRQRGIRRPITDLKDAFAIEPKDLPRRESRVELGLDLVRSTLRTAIGRVVRAARGIIKSGKSHR